MSVSGAISSIFALDPQKSINQYGLDIWLHQNGLPANAVNVVIQSHDGYLWCGTAAGLFRFDGVRFERVSTDPEDSKNQEAISALCEGRDGSLWIGTAFNCLRHLKDGKITRYDEHDGIMSQNITTILDSRTDQLWLGTSNGLYKFINEKFESIPVSPNFITAIAEDSDGRLWIGTHSGIHIFKEGGEIKSNNIILGTRDQMVTSVFVADKGNVWIGTSSKLLHWKKGKLSTITIEQALSDNYITTINIDKNCNLWVGTNDGGVNRLANGTWTSFTVKDGMCNNHILSIVEDYEGSLWISTLDGLMRFKDVNLTTFTTKEGLASNYISGVIEAPDGSIYFLSDQKSSVSRLKKGKITTISTMVGPAYLARDGSLWIGQTGLLQNLKNGRLTRYDTHSGLPNNWITAISEDRESLILNMDGIGVRRFVNGHLEPFLLRGGQKYNLKDYVSSFYLEPDGALFIGKSCGLEKIKDGQLTDFVATGGISAHYWIGSMFDDGRGSLWLSSPRSGLTRFKDGKFFFYTTKVGLFSNEIYCVLVDDSGDLWMSSPRGIGHIKRQDFDDFDAGRIKSLHTQVFVTADGMKSDECFGGWQPASWKAHNGNLWFATKKGAVMIDPRAFKRNELPPPVLIERIIVDQRTVPLDQVVSLTPGTEKLEFHYTALSFLVPERVLFNYKLEGYDRDWVEAGARRVAYYTNLPPGEYRFRVMACNNDGLWNETGASFMFELKPHFYQTYWFYGLMAILLVGIVYSLIRLRLWQLVEREKELRNRIEEALANIKILGGLIPICASCKKIRDDKGYWKQLEEYVQSRSEAKFTHGICPDCAKKLYPNVSFTKKNS